MLGWIAAVMLGMAGSCIWCTARAFQQFGDRYRSIERIDESVLTSVAPTR